MSQEARVEIFRRSLGDVEYFEVAKVRSTRVRADLTSMLYGDLPL